MQKCSVEIAFTRLLMAIYTLSNNKSVACRNSCSGYFHTLTKFIVLSAHGKAFKMFFSDTRNVTAKWKIVQTGPLWHVLHYWKHYWIIFASTCKSWPDWQLNMFALQVFTTLCCMLVQIFCNKVCWDILFLTVSHCLHFQLIHPTLPTELYWSMFLCPRFHDYTACQ